MPLKTIPPREGKTKNWSIRGTYLGVYVDRSSGSPRKSVAKRKLTEIQGQIERGEFSGAAKDTFLGAAIAYMKGGGEKRYLKPLIDYFGAEPIARIDQAAIDQAAAKLYPPGVTEDATPHNATLNRQVYTPVSAILRAAGKPLLLSRPKQPKGNMNWLEPHEAAVWLGAASLKLRRLTIHLLYTGCRITETCDLLGRNMNLRQALAYVGETKNGDPRAVHIPPALMAELRRMTFKPNERVYGYRDRWEIYDDWNPLRDELDFPEWWTPHAACHTWATWMRQYAAQDLRGLLGTGRWRDLKSVLRYQHVVTSEESRAADLLPDLEKRWTKDKDSA